MTDVRAARSQRIVVESWAPEYGSPFEAQGTVEASGPVDPDVEMPLAQWKPVRPPEELQPVACLDFVDGVRRIDARVWITDESGASRMGVCASYAAGVARCDSTATIRSVQVRRGIFAPGAVPTLETGAGTYVPMTVAGDDVDAIYLGLQQRMGELEIHVASLLTTDDEGSFADMVVMDGPLSGRHHIKGAIGYVKTHRVAYLPPEGGAVVGALKPGERTPLFVTQTSWSRFSWYLRLPGPGGHPWAGVVRCEASADRPREEVRRLADATARTLPRFASAAHKDPRAPQNLYPIAALERELRRRLGDARWVERALRVGAR